MDRAEDLQMHNWRSAQAPILLGGSLIPAALQLLRFLRDVDQHPCLYRGPAVSQAIRRYEDFWLPLLNQHNATFPLHPPLDCAWIWHVHRLNPIAYARDCEMLFGRLLDVSCKAHDDKSDSVELTRGLWEQRFPDESYDLDLSRFQYDAQWVPHMQPENATRIEYNLAAAVMRQQGFFYQVSQSHFEDERFLEAAQQRYKAFLHLFKITEFKMFLVPTYDIDLMWHAHQLHPKTYIEDLTNFLGRVLEHDDSDSDRSPGQKLDKGFHETCELWLQNYGDVYERAGAMYRGLPPAPVPPSHQIPAVGTPIDFAPLTPREVMQVYVTILRVQNLPKKQGDIRVRLKLERKCSSFKLETFSVPLREGAFWKHTWTFEAEKSTKALKIELLRRHSSILRQMMKGSDVLGYTSVSWEYLLSMPTLSLSGWLPLTLGLPQSNCPSLYVCISLTPPGPAPYLLRIINSLPTDDNGRMGMGGFSDRRGCWLTRTVLDHSNKQMFIIRAKFSDGFTRTPEDKKCIYIHQGGWVYKNSHSTRGYAPAAVVAVANQVVTGQESKYELSKQRCWCFFDNTSELLVRASDVDPNWDLGLDLELSGNLRGQV
ncbi:hypothetical protein KP509_20G017300 [Ceratopteris richardii]|uniref:Glycine-rich domain-containing protein 1 n=1 Tax=Ceratopteris richardii TaxID=49495 RepID=A0A8T2SGW7_CERRI|nr:hypothetical protein KP509_20G017300 [Ceratopteris richardii]